MSLPTPQNDLVRGALGTIATLGESERYWRINAYEALWEGLHYEGRPSFWDTSVPLRERAPAVQSFLARTAGRRLASMVFGERSFPTIGLKPRAFGPALTLPDAVLALVEETIESAALRVRMREYTLQGLKCGSVCALACLRDGLPALDLVPSKWCTPELAADGSVRSLVIQWQTMATEDGEVVQYVHRREITATTDTMYVPRKNDGKPIDWTRATVECTYAVEFCPAEWTRNNADPTEGAEIDGYPLAYGLEDEILALDLALSQGHRNALYNGEPQMVRTGLDADQSGGSMGPQGRTANPDAGAFSWFNTASGALKGWAFGGTQPATKKAPGTIWNLPTGADAKLLESTGAGMGIISTDAANLRRVILDAVGVVLADPDLLGKGDLSSKALHLMHAPMLDVADNMREEYGRALCRILNAFLRLYQTAAARSAGVLLPSWEAALPALIARSQQRTDGTSTWLPVPLSLTWGEYFEPSWSDVTSAVTAARTGVEGGVLSRAAAVKMLSAVSGVADAKAEAAAIAADLGAHAAAMGRVLGTDAPAAEDPSTIEHAKDPTTALNGAQVASLLSIVEQVAARQIPRATGVALVMAAFPLDGAQADHVLGEVGRTFFTTPPPEHAAAMATLKSEHAAMSRSHQSTRAMLASVLERNKRGELVTGSPIARAADDGTDG